MVEGSLAGSGSSCRMPGDGAWELSWPFGVWLGRDVQVGAEGSGGAQPWEQQWAVWPGEGVCFVLLLL